MNPYLAAMEIAGMAQACNMRIAQLIHNATDGEDIFYLHDDDLVLKCRQYMRGYMRGLHARRASEK